jgi:sialic acid synthase SpsE
VAGTRKPVIISTGMADADEIDEAVAAARDGGCRELALLHCVSGYPAPAADYNLRTLSDMIDRWGVVTGLSDHTLDNTTAIAAVALGAALVEKHFTLDRDGGGPDDSFSLLPAELAQLCQGARTAWSALGRVDYGRKRSEVGNAQFRRSLYFVKPLQAGDTITADAVRSVRPGFGLAPKHLDAVIGKRLLPNPPDRSRNFIAVRRSEPQCRSSLRFRARADVWHLGKRDFTDIFRQAKKRAHRVFRNDL